MRQMTPQLLTVREVAAVMRVSNMTVYRLIKAGDLIATRVGRSYRIFEDDVSTYLGRGTN
jgi:excisionase family DNA binding protein